MAITAIAGTARLLERERSLSLNLLYKAAPVRLQERGRTLSMVLAYHAAPVREFLRDRGNLRVSGFVTPVAGRLRLSPPRLNVAQVYVLSKAAPLRVDPRVRAVLSLTGVTKATLRTTLRLEERAIGTELVTYVSAAELRAQPRVRGAVTVLFPIAAAVGRVRLDERLIGKIQKSGFLTQLLAQVRVTERVRGVTTAPLSTGITLLGSGTAREVDRLIGYRSRIIILRRRYVGPGGPHDSRYPPGVVGSTGSRYTQTVTDTAGARYPTLPVFDDPSLDA